MYAHVRVDCAPPRAGQRISLSPKVPRREGLYAWEKEREASQTSIQASDHPDRPRGSRSFALRGDCTRTGSTAEAEPRSPKSHRGKTSLSDPPVHGTQNPQSMLFPQLAAVEAAALNTAAEGGEDCNT
jgi:hypothetical protein